MKKAAALLLILVTLLPGCDKIDLPRETTYSENDNPGTDPVARHKVLLEDYTGHQCGNCLGAAEVASALQKQYGDDLVVIAVHAGHFAKTSTKYPTSYTTAVGNDWNLEFIGANGLYPNGTVNRKDYTGSGIMSKETKWAAHVDLAFKEQFIVDLVLEQKYDPSTRDLDVVVKGYFKAPYEKNLVLSVVLLEDGIIGPQTDYRIEGHLVPNYVFDHMLRDAVTGSWGTEFTSSAKAAGDSVIVSFDNFPVQAGFNDKKLTVAAFVSEKETRSVIEAEKIKISAAASSD